MDGMMIHGWFVGIPKEWVRAAWCLGFDPVLGFVHFFALLDFPLPLHRCINDCLMIDFFL